MLVNGLAGVVAGVPGQDVGNLENDEAKVIDGLDPGAGAQLLAIVEPLHPHRGIVDRGQPGFEMGQRIFGQHQVFQGAQEFWRSIGVLGGLFHDAPAAETFEVGDLVHRSLHSLWQLGVHDDVAPAGTLEGGRRDSFAEAVPGLACVLAAVLGVDGADLEDDEAEVAKGPYARSSFQGFAVPVPLDVQGGVVGRDEPGLEMCVLALLEVAHVGDGHGETGCNSRSHRGLGRRPQLHGLEVLNALHGVLFHFSRHLEVKG